MHKSPFTILATGTPDMNRFSDVEVLLQSIQPNEETVQVTVTSLGPALTGYIPCNGADNDDVYLHNIPRCTLKYAGRFVFANIVRTSQMVKARTNLLAVCTIKRNFMSILKCKPIKSRMPPFAARRVGVEFSANDFSKYLQIAEKPLKQLILKLPNLPYPVYNFESVRELLLYGLWLRFEKTHKKYTAEECKRIHAIKGISLAAGLCADYHKKNGLPMNEVPTTPEARLKLLLTGAPKMQAILHFVNSMTVVREKKILIFCSVPAQLLYIQACLAEAGISVESMHAGLNPSQRSDLQTRWNTADTPMVLLTTPAIGGTGWNFQGGGNIGVLVDPMTSYPAEEQCIGRIYRFGQVDGVLSVTFITEGSFNEVQIDNGIKKALPGFMVSLYQAFLVSKSSTQMKIFSKSRLDLSSNTKSSSFLLRVHGWKI